MVILTESWMKDDVHLPGAITYSNVAQKSRKKKLDDFQGV